jgi:hypothetical protein
MVPLLMALQLAATPAAASSTLVPPLSLDLGVLALAADDPAPPASGAPLAASPMTLEERAGPSLVGPTFAAAGGMFVGDLVTLPIVMAGLVMTWETTLYSSSHTTWGPPVLVAGMLAFTLGPPALATAFARGAGADGAGFWRPYLAGLGARLAGWLVVGLLSAAGPAASVAVLAVEFVTTPWVIARVGLRPPPPAPPPDVPPAALARPVRDPAMRS